MHSALVLSPPCHGLQVNRGDNYRQSVQVGGRRKFTENTRALIERAIYLGMDNYELFSDELHAEDVVNHGPVEDDHDREACDRRQAQHLLR